MSKELVRKLRWRGDRGDDTCSEAADRIEELERENNELAARIGKELNEENLALQADNARLREVLVKHVAPYLGHKEVYDEVLASIPAQSLARLRNRVLNKAINVAWNHEPDCNGPIEMALRKLKEPE